MTQIRAGQHWREMDPRFDPPRVVEVVSLDVLGELVKIRRLPDAQSPHLTYAPRYAKAARFNGKRGGYTLVRDAT